MDNLRRRIPRPPNLEDEDESRILDDQEQEALISELRVKDERINRQYYIYIRVVLALSLIWHSIYFLTPSLGNPYSYLPFVSLSDPPIPYSRALALFAIFLHMDLVFLIHPEFGHVRPIRVGQYLFRPASNPMVTVIAACAAGVLAFYLGHSWVTISWWLTAPTVLGVVGYLHAAIVTSTARLNELDSLRYPAPGA